MAHEFVMIDLETLGTPGDCKTTFIAVPSAAFVIWNGFEATPHIIYLELPVQAQLEAGAKVSASTIAFWMGEATRGSTAAKRIVDILSEDTFKITETSKYDIKLMVESNLDIDPLAIVNSVLAEGYKDVPFYGNGPEFDLAIYESLICNMVPGTEAPWAFWATSSARTLKELYRDDDMDYNILMQESFVFAEHTMEATGFLNEGHTPVKHNPIFDALAEAYVVASVKEHFLKNKKILIA